MPTLSRARFIKFQMGFGYHIYWDDLYRCFRVMPRWSPSLFKNEKRYTFVE